MMEWWTPVAWAQEGGTSPGGGSPLTLILMFGLIAVVWWWLMFRPQQKREKERKEMIGALRKGDNVITVGGIHARVYAVEEAVVTLEIGRDVRFKCEKSAVVGQVGEEPPKDDKSDKADKSK